MYIAHPQTSAAKESIVRMPPLLLKVAIERFRLEAFRVKATLVRVPQWWNACRRWLLRPIALDTYRQLAQAALDEGSFDVARNIALSTGRFGRSDYDIQAILGLACFRLNRLAEAERALHLAVRMHTTSEHRQVLVEVLLLQGRFEEARVQFAGDAKTASVEEPDRTWLKFAFERGIDLPMLPSGFVVAEQITGRDWCQRTGNEVRDVDGIEEIPFEAPVAIGTDLPPFKATTLSNQPYVADLRNVTIFSHSNIVLTADGFAINDTGAHSRFGSFVSHQSDRIVVGQRGTLLLLDTRDPLEPIDAGLFLSGVVSNAFGHWVPEYLPKLQFYRHHPDVETMPVIVDDDMPESHFDYLACFAPNSLYKLPARSARHCARLLYAPPATFFPVHLLPGKIPDHEVGPVSPRSYRFLKAGVEARYGVARPRGRKYFLSRRNMKWRMLANDREIAVFLEAKGFETICLEDHSFADQVHFFQAASHIVAANGSSMQNIIFSDPSVRLYVLCQDYIANYSAYNAQTRALGYRCIFVCGYSVEGVGKHANYHVPVNLLNEALNREDLWLDDAQKNT